MFQFLVFIGDTGIYIQCCTHGMVTGVLLFLLWHSAAWELRFGSQLAPGIHSPSTYFQYLYGRDGRVVVHG